LQAARVAGSPAKNPQKSKFRKNIFGPLPGDQSGDSQVTKEKGPIKDRPMCTKPAFGEIRKESR